MVENSDRLIRVPEAQGRAVSDLGGLDRVLSARAVDLGQPEDVVIASLLAAWPTPRAREVASWITNALQVCSGPIEFERSVELLLTHPEARAAMADELIDTFLVRAKVHDTAEVGYIAATALRGMIVLLLEGNAPTRQLDAVMVLRDVSHEADAAFALEAARMTGVVYAHWSDPSIRQALVDGLDRLERHPEVGVDALVEHAQVLLIEALEAEDALALQAGLEAARTLFQRAAEAEEDRVDALVYAHALRAIEVFAWGGPPATLANAAGELRELLAERELYGHQEGLPPLSRRAVEGAWESLLTSVATVASDLDVPVWARGADVIARVLEVVERTRSVRLTPLTNADVAPVVVPRLEAAFVRNLYHRQILAQCLAEEDLSPAQRHVAQQLLERVNLGVDAHTGDPLVAGLGVEGADAIRDALPPDKLAQATERLRLALALRTSGRDAQWAEAYDSIVVALEDAPDFHGEVRARVLEIVGSLLDFVDLCLRVELGFGSGAFAYLGDAETHESVMADHLAMYLTMALGIAVRTEVRHEGAGGRVDVLVGWGRDRFVIECKRDANPVARGVLDPYLAQTGRYLGTSVRIGALAVLDLSDKATGVVRGLDASAWVVDVPSRGDAPARKVICCMIPGNRAATPSAVGRATPKGR